MNKLICLLLCALSTYAQTTVKSTGVTTTRTDGITSPRTNTSNFFTTTFDGSTYMRRNFGSGFSNLTDSQRLTIVALIRFTANDGSQREIIYKQPASRRFVLERSSTNKLQFSARTSGGTLIVNAASSVDLTTTNGWTMVMVAVDTTAPVLRMWFNGTEDPSPTVTTLTLNGTMDLIDTSATDGINIGGGNSGANGFTGSLGPIWIDDTYNTDPTKFGTGNMPIYLGITGQLPTGTSPALYFSRNGGGVAMFMDSSGNGSRFFTAAGSPTAGIYP